MKQLDINFTELEDSVIVSAELIVNDHQTAKMEQIEVLHDADGYKEVLNWLGYEVEEIWDFPGTFEES